MNGQWGIGAQAPALAACAKVLDVAARHADACRESADQLAYLHGEAELLRAPAYDVPTAQDVLQSGTPSIPSIFPYPPPSV